MDFDGDAMRGWFSEDAAKSHAIARIASLPAQSLPLQSGCNGFPPPPWAMMSGHPRGHGSWLSRRAELGVATRADPWQPIVTTTNGAWPEPRSCQYQSFPPRKHRGAMAVPERCICHAVDDFARRAPQSMDTCDTVLPQYHI